MALPLVWLGDVLRSAGLNVVETPGWKTRTASGPQPLPVGVLEHHTATLTSYGRPAPTVQLCIDGRPDLDGPLCHGVIAYNGVIHLIAAGRANHAGKAKASGPNPAGDGNTLYVGFEWDYQGVKQGPSPEQYDAAVRATAAVLKRIGRPADAARGHRETSVTGKIDPGLVDLNRFRADVARAMTSGINPAQPGGIESMALDTQWVDTYNNRQTVEGFMRETQRDLNDALAAVQRLERVVLGFTTDQAETVQLPAHPTKMLTETVLIPPKYGRVTGDAGEVFVNIATGENAEVAEVFFTEDWVADGKPGKRLAESTQGKYTLIGNDRQSFKVPGAATQVSIRYQSETTISVAYEVDAKWQVPA